MPCTCGKHGSRKLCEAFRNPETDQERALNKMWVESVTSMQQQRWNNLDRLNTSLQATAKSFKEQLDALVKDTAETGHDNAAGMLRIQSLANDIKGMSRDAGIKVSNETQKMIQDIFDESQKRAAWMLDQATPSNIEINMDLVPKDQILSMIGQTFEGGMFSKRIFEISDQMAADIQTRLTQGMLTGESIKDMADGLYDIFGDESSGYYYRATLIARTETIKAREMGRDRLFKQNQDIIEEEVWVGMESECEQCAEIESRHNDGGETYLQPVIDTHPNCVCTKTVKLKAWDDLVAPDNEDEEVPEEPKPYQQFIESMVKEKNLPNTDEAHPNAVNMAGKWMPLIGKEEGKGIVRSIVAELSPEEQQFYSKMDKIEITGKFSPKYAGVHKEDMYGHTWIQVKPKYFKEDTLEILKKTYPGKPEVWERMNGKAILNHEFGHEGLARMATPEKVRVLKPILEERIKFGKGGVDADDVFPTWYSKKNPDEHFCESLMLYKQNASQFKKDFPILAQSVETYLDIIKGAAK